MGNPFENDFAGVKDGRKEYNDSSSPNQEELNEKRDEYLVDAVSRVLKNYNQDRINLLCEHEKDIESNRDAKAVLVGIISNVKNELLGKRGYIFNIPQNRAKDKKVADAFEELEATYPDDMIEGMIWATLEHGYL